MTRLLHLIAAVALVLIVVLPGLGGSGLLDPWEMERAATARRIASNAQVLVVDDGGKLLRDLAVKAPDLSLHRVDSAAAQGLRVAAGQMGDRLTHALVVDVDAVIGQRDDHPTWDRVATQLDRVRQENRGVLMLLVSDARTPAVIAQRVAEGRARGLHRAMQGGFWRHGVPDKHPEALSALLAGTERIVARTAAASTLLAEVPSPWARVQHKVNKQSVQAPLLDTWLVALSLKLLGSSETAARLPGAVLAALTGLLLFIAMARLLGLEAAWMALIVYLTLPLMIGNARMVTLAQTAPLGVALTTFGLALGVAGGEGSGAAIGGKARAWALWVVAGLVVLFLGRGLGGLTMGVAICVGYVLVSADLRRGPVLAAIGALLALGLASALVLSDDAGALLRSFRFTQIPFGGGLPESRRDFSVVIGMVGFSLYPWGALFLVAIGRLLVANSGAAPMAGASGATDDGPALERARLALVMGFGAPLVVVVALLPEFHQLVVPVAAVVAAVTATLLRDIRLGRAGGPVLTLLIVIPTLLLHREIGKEASTLVRWLAWDPPFGGDSAVYQWPQELKMNRGLRAIAFLSVFAFALGLSRPVAWMRRSVARFERVSATAWLLGGLASIWALDVLISLGTRTDVLLRAEALRTGYTYDRMWTAIQTTRPEVIAGAFAFVALVVGAALASSARAQRRPWAWLAALSSVVQHRAVALGLVAAASVAQLIAGLLVWTQQHPGGVGGGLTVGLTSAPFALPALVALVGGLDCWWATRRAAREAAAAAAGELGVAETSGSLFSGIASSLSGGLTLVVGVAGLVALGGIGIAASQAAGTWSYGFLAATWALALAVVLVIGGRARSDRGSWALGAFAVGLVVAGSLATALAVRLQPLAPDGARYLARVLIASPDSALWVGLLVLALANHLARTSVVMDLLRYTGLEIAALIERPRIATALPMLAAIVMTGGYAFGLLPELSLHFSQKHLLERTGVAAGDAGAALDSDGLPRVFKYAPGGRHTIASNFYTQTMPTLGDQAAAVALLGGKNVAARVSDFGPESRSLDLAVPGWNPSNDADKDGKRDHKAWFGIATRTGAKRVQSDSPGWEPGQWKGATLYNGRGQKSVVASSNDNAVHLVDEVPLSPADPNRGSFALETAKPSAVAAGKVDANASAMRPVQRFVVVPKDSFSELNFHFRRANAGRHIQVIDARSSRLVLTATHLTQGQPDDSWLGKQVLTRATFDSLKGVLRTEVNFDDKLFIVGYRLAKPTVRRAQKYKLTVFFEVRKGLASSYMIFMHPHPLHRDLWPGAIHPQSDREGKRCTGCFQTNHWLKGDIVSVVIEQEVPLGTAAGSHDIIMGLFNPLNDKRLIIKSASGPGIVRHNDNRVTLGKLVVR